MGFCAGRIVRTTLPAFLGFSSQLAPILLKGEWHLQVEYRAPRRRCGQLLLSLSGLLLKELCRQAGPAGLMAGADAHAVIAVEVFVEPDVVGPVRALEQSAVSTLERTPAFFVLSEQACHPSRKLIRNLIKRQKFFRTYWAFNFEVIAVVVVELLERLN